MAGPNRNVRTWLPTCRIHFDWQFGFEFGQRTSRVHANRRQAEIERQLGWMFGARRSNPDPKPHPIPCPHPIQPGQTAWRRVPHAAGKKESGEDSLFFAEFAIISCQLIAKNCSHVPGATFAYSPASRWSPCSEGKEGELTIPVTSARCEWRSWFGLEKINIKETQSQAWLPFRLSHFRRWT